MQEEIKEDKNFPEAFIFLLYTFHTPVVLYLVSLAQVHTRASQPADSLNSRPIVRCCTYVRVRNIYIYTLKHGPNNSASKCFALIIRFII